MIRNLISRIFIRLMILKGYLDLNTMHRNTVNARKKNEKLLFKIIARGADSEYGKKYNFKGIKSVQDYRKLVPIVTYDGYEPYTRKMIEGNAQNVLTSSHIICFAETTGSTGDKKFIPITQKDVNVYTKYTVTRMLAVADKYHKRHRTPKKPFRGMFVSPAFDRVLPNGYLVSNIPDVAAKQLGWTYPFILNVPFPKLFKKDEVDFKYLDLRFALEDKETLFVFCVFFRAIAIIIDYMKENWEVLVDDIEKGTISDLACANEETKQLLLKTVKPNPKRAAELRREFEKGFDETLFGRLWPNLETICGLGTHAFEHFCKISRNYTKGIPYDYSIYGASEGLFAAVDELEQTKQLLLVDSCYYEFIPIDDTSKILSLDELEIGKEYEIIITNQAGFYRYSFGDVIKVIDYMNECPYVEFSHRQGTLLNLAGDKTNEEQMEEVVKTVSEAAGIPLDKWAVAISMNSLPYHYDLLVENDKGVDLSTYSDLADQKLQKLNLRYFDMQKMNLIGKIKIKNLKPGTQDAYIERLVKKGAPITQVKPVRILNKDDSKDFYLDRIL